MDGMGVDLSQLRRGIEDSLVTLAANIGEIDRYLVSGEGNFHHPHELRAMLEGVKKISEFVLACNMDIEMIKTPEGQVIAREVLRAHQCYEAFASLADRKAYDFEDTRFFFMWLLESPAHL